VVIGWLGMLSKRISVADELAAALAQVLADHGLRVVEGDADKDKPQ